jgi:sigma-B regulation protein RsbU (phosphoserine phosphatase)
MNTASTVTVQTLRPRLIEKRRQLEQAAGTVSADYLLGLLHEVDAALARLDQGTFGLCETCHDPIEADRLEVNPLVRFCIDHMNAAEMRAHERDLELAAQIQSRLLPSRELRLRRWESFFLYQPAGPVGGDYCEITQLENDSSFFAVGDIAGKGVAGSLLMTHLHAILRSLLTLPMPLGELLAKANRLFCENTLTSHYATLACLRATGDRLEYANAGHCAPFLVRNGVARRLDNAGLPLGLFCAAEYDVSEIVLEPGDALVLYSDGISEAQHADGEEFGEARLAQSLSQHAGLSAEAMAKAVYGEVAAFRGGTKPHDDVTLLIARRN